MLSEDSDQPAHLCSLIRIFTGHILDSKDVKFLHGENKNNKDSDQTAWMRKLICLCWKHMSESMFSHMSAPIFMSSCTSFNHAKSEITVNGWVINV